MHFQAHDSKTLITTSFKCMYSSLRRASSIRLVTDAHVMRELVRRRLGFARFTHYVIGRNPHSRVESFFRNKLRHALKVYRDRPYEGWEQSHKLLFRYVGITNGHSPTEISDRLRAVSFGDFIDLLPKIMYRDAHLFPQVASLNLRLGQLRVMRITADTIVKMESATEVAAMWKALGEPEGERHNRTDNLRIATEWTDAGRAKVRQLYLSDFEAFGYR